MHLFEHIIRGLTWFFCGPRAPYQPSHPEEEVAVPPSLTYKPQEHRPQAPSVPPSYAHPHAQQQHQQKPAVQPQPQRHQRPAFHAHEDHRQNPHYISLKANVEEVASEMHRLSRESQEAYKRGDGARAKELSNQSKAKRAEMEELNQKAAQWLFRENNKDRPLNEIDLHGLTVDQAIEFTERAIQDARGRGDSEIHIIVGKGLHSVDNKPKIKPAVEGLMVKYQLVAELDPSNAGVLIVSLTGHDTGTGEVVQPDEIAQRIDDARDDRCIVM